MTARLRAWCEFLPPDELGADATLNIVERYGLEPLVALPPDRETEAMGRALGRLSAAGARVGLWPLLSDEDGYWPSERNATLFVHRVHDALAFAESHGATVQTVAIDLEPPLETTRALTEGGRRARVLARGIASAALRSSARQSATETYARLAADLRQRQIESIAAVVPLVVMELMIGPQPWQAVLQTPVTKPGWDVISPMFYTSMIAAALPVNSPRAARRILYRGAQLMRRYASPAKASVSLGLVGTGKLGTEPTIADVETFAKDVGLTRRAGVDDIALFSLEGILRQPRPEEWLDAAVSTTA